MSEAVFWYGDRGGILTLIGLSDSTKSNLARPREKLSERIPISLERQSDISSEPTRIRYSSSAAEVTPKGSEAKLENGAAVDGVSTVILFWSVREDFENK